MHGGRRESSSQRSCHESLETSPRCIRTLFCPDILFLFVFRIYGPFLASHNPSVSRARGEVEPVLEALVLCLWRMEYMYIGLQRPFTGVFSLVIKRAQRGRAWMVC